MRNWRFSKYRTAWALFIILGSAVCIISSDAYAGGVHFGFGVDVPLPSPVVAPPVVVYPSPVVVERTPPPVVYEQAPPAVMIKRVPPRVVYEEPVVVERRSTVYYYPPAKEYRPYHEETEREYYRQRSHSWEDNDQY